MVEEHNIFVRAVKGAGFLSIQSALNVVLGIILFMYMARVLTKEELGVYTSIGIISAIAVWAGTLGMDAAIARFSSKLIGEGKVSTASLTAKRILTAMGFYILLAATILFFASPTISYLMLGSGNYTSLFQLDQRLV